MQKLFVSLIISLPFLGLSSPSMAVQNGHTQSGLKAQTSGVSEPHHSQAEDSKIGLRPQETQTEDSKIGLRPQKTTQNPPAKVTILIGVDGFSFRALEKAQQQGLFKAFQNKSAHISPFPSMTDLSWSMLTKTASIFGTQGRIRSVEATYFDETTQSIQGDPRDYYRRLAFPKYYLNAFQNFFNPYVEGLMYFPTKEMAKLEIDNVVDSILKSKESLITAYIGGIDSTAHTQYNRLFPVLTELDRGLNKLFEKFSERNQPVEIILVSDHGNVGRFPEGSAEKELEAVNLKPWIEKAGFHSVQQLNEPRDVAIPLMALGTWAPVYMKDRSLRQELISALSQQPWFDLAISIRKNTATGTIIEITGADQSRAQLQFDRTNSLTYYVELKGNPLKLPEAFASHPGNLIPITSAKALEITLETPYPDSIQRLITSVSNRDFDFPDFILTLKDGYFVQNSLSSFTKMYRTHGSLTAASTFGFLASSQRQLPTMIRTQDILAELHIDPAALFGQTARLYNQSGRTAETSVLQQAKTGLATEARVLSSKRIFHILSRFIADSRSYFVVSEIESFLKAFNIDPLTEPTKNALQPNPYGLAQLPAKRLITTNDIAEFTDILINNQKAPLSAIKDDPRLEKIKKEISRRQNNDSNTKQKPTTGDTDDFLDSLLKGTPQAYATVQPYTQSGKRVAMKIYQLPFLLEKAITIPEKTHLPETRDVFFAQYWHRNHVDFASGKFPLDTPHSAGTVGESLFKEILKEQSLEERIFPTPINKLYNQRLNNTTIVYIPGIYNSLFDREIFSLGIAALKEEFGLRVIIPPVDSICAKEYNGKLIIDFLKNDYKARIERGFSEPQYLILGYSKGAVDALQSLTLDREFAARNILGLVSIASPLHGSSILDKADLPFVLVDLLSDHQGHILCRKEQPSGPSISPSAMDLFWRKNERSLIGITRYFSISFKSEPENSHFFMKATKLIAQFDEENDGVVPLSSSKFPKALGAVDIATLEADHLAGILSSKFDQKSFLRAIVNTMAELDIENKQSNLQFNASQILTESQKISGLKDYRLNVVKEGVTVLPSYLTFNGLLHPTKALVRLNNSFELNQLLIPDSHDLASEYQTQVKLPPNQLAFDPYRMLDVQKLTDIFASFRVTPTTPENTPNGIQIDFHHQHMVHFRMDYQLNFESRSPMNLDDNTETGYAPANFAGEPFLVMRSKNNSIRLTTMAYRFKPADFANMDLRLAVTKGVKGADPVFGGAGRDDSAFQVWFTLRYGETSDDRTLIDAKTNEVLLFGYYWGDPAPNGDDRKPGQIFENWYSRKNVVVATLPESRQLLLNDQSMIGAVQNFKQNLVADLQKAFPQRDVSKMEIVAITIQHDSNDSGDSSEAYFQHLRFSP